MAQSDVRKLDREISGLEQPTVGALKESLAAIAEERQGLQSLADHIASRQATLDEMEATIRALPGAGGATAKKATRKKATRKKATSKKASRKKATRKKATRKRTATKKAATRKAASKQATPRSPAPGTVI